VGPVGIGLPPPFRPVATPTAALPVASRPARDAAWARRDETPTTIGVVTVAVLGALVVGAALAGRRREQEGQEAV
jgi:MYXO-CTERM domain-containing protein